MQMRNWAGMGACVALLGLIACGSNAGGDGGGTFVAKDAANAGDLTAASDGSGADVASAPDAAADAALEIAQADVPAAEVAEDVAADIAVDVAPDVKQPVKTVGGLVNPPLAPPTFLKVVDSTAAKVTPDALQGHWTVLWFYPAASTAG